MDLNRENVKKIMKITAFGIILYFGLQNLETLKNLFIGIVDILSPFLYGAAFAFILNIPMNMFEKRLFKSKKLGKIKRPVSIVLAFILIILIIYLIIKLVIPQLINVIIMFFGNVPTIVYEIKDWAINLTQQYPDISNQIKNTEINWEQIVRELVTFSTNLAGNLLSSSIGVIVAVIGGIFDSIISIVFAIYILSSKEKLEDQYKKIIKAYFSTERAKYILEIMELSKTTFYNFITGQCTEAVILGVLCFIGMLILRLPFALTISVLIGTMNLIPIIGAFIGIIIGAILILSISPIKAAIFIIFLIVLQQFENNVIYPKVVGNSVGIPGMWILVAVVVGGSLGGIIGLLIGLPTISVIYTIFRDDVHRKLKQKEQIENA